MTPSRSQDSQASSPRSEGRHRALLAWYGVGAMVPDSWNVVAVSGTPRQGYLRADGADEESMELRWQRSRRKPDLQLVARDFLKQVQRLTKKEKLDYSGEAGKSSPGKGSKTPDELWFRWEAGRRGIGRLVWCAECKRTVISQVTFPASSGRDALAEEVLKTLRDHSEPGVVDWGIYGVSFRLPEKFRLTRHRLMSGFLSLNFIHRGQRVIVERWGLAEMLTSASGFAGWHKREYLAELKFFRGDSSAVEWGDHEALQTEGHEGGIRRIQALARAFGLPGRAERFGSIAWHCEQTNRIVGVRAFGRNPLQLATKVAASLRCHSR